MLRAHRQAWAWQDEWIGLNMDDIRALEKETQELLAKKMAQNDSITGNRNSLMESSSWQLIFFLSLSPGID